MVPDGVKVQKFSCHKHLYRMLFYRIFSKHTVVETVKQALSI